MTTDPSIPTPEQTERDGASDQIALDRTTAERRRRGEGIIDRMSNGAPRPPVLDALERDFPFLYNAVSAFAVGEIFERTVLDVRTRQLALCAAFSALGLTDFLKVHARYALDAGVSEDELKEIANITIIPAGFPRAIMASQAISELLASR